MRILFLISFSLIIHLTLGWKANAKGVILHGQVKDAKTHQFVSGVVSIYFDTDILKSRSFIENGEFAETLAEYGWYIISVAAKGYNEISDTVWVLSDARKETTKEFLMTPKEVSGIKTSSVYFGISKTNLKAGSETELDQVITFLEEHKEMSCKLGGHADRSGSAIYNLELSEKRALAVADYLVSKGIDRARLKVVAFGSLSPINASESIDDHAKNRRVELIPYVKKTQDDANVVFDNILFEYGKYNLSERTDIELEDIAMFLKDNPLTSCEIAGHADNTGSSYGNLVLSKERAQIVMNYLVSKGIQSSRLKVRGHGDSRPVMPNNTLSGRAGNRRVEFIILD